MSRNNVLFTLTKAVNIFVPSSCLLTLALFIKVLGTCSQQYIGSDPCRDSHAALLINLPTECVGVT
jgi:hypothetical protein